MVSLLWKVRCTSTNLLEVLLLAKYNPFLFNKNGLITHRVIGFYLKKFSRVILTNFIFESEIGKKGQFCQRENHANAVDQLINLSVERPVL